jgi:hypothetical protein
MEPVPTCDAGFRTACCATRRRVPRPTTFLAGFTSPIRPSTALKRARDVLKHDPGLPSPAEEVLKGASKAWKVA